MHAMYSTLIGALCTCEAGQAYNDFKTHNSSQHVDLGQVTDCHSACCCRQIEAMKDWGWTHPSFDFYVQYLAFKLKLYTDIAGASGRYGWPAVWHSAGTQLLVQQQYVAVLVFRELATPLSSRGLAEGTANRH